MSWFGPKWREVALDEYFALTGGIFNASGSNDPMKSIDPLEDPGRGRKLVLAPLFIVSMSPAWLPLRGACFRFCRNRPPMIRIPGREV